MRLALASGRAAAVALGLALGALPTGTAGANPWNFVGARQQAMGGAGVADTRDSTANYWNPANLAFQKGWGVNLPATIDAAIENRAVEKLSNLLVGFDELGALGDQILQCGPSCVGTALGPEQRDQIARFLVDFAEYGKSGENVHVGASLGLAGRFGSFGVSALSLTQGTVFPNTDLANLSIGPAINELVGPGPYQTPSNTDLRDDVETASGGALTNAQAGQLVYLLEQAGANTADPTVRQLATGLVEQGANAGFFDANDTGALAAGLAIQEFAISWAHVLPVPFIEKTQGPLRDVLEMVHQKVALSITPKYLLGVAFVKFFRYDDTESASGIVTELADIESSSVSSNFGLDIGLAYRPTPWLRFGMMARNVNSPSFDIEPFFTPDGRYFSSIEVESQVRMGMALIPVENLTLAFDFDATSNQIETLPGFESRYVSLGVEYVIPFSRHLDLALRLGGYNNVSDTVDSDWALTGGVGLRAGSFHLDLSAGGAFSDETIRTGSTSFDTFPTRLNVGLGLSWEKSL